jgi:hypothetical protein
MNEILVKSYWEQFKWEKELAQSHPVDHPKRVEAYKNTNDAYQTNKIIILNTMIFKIKKKREPREGDTKVVKKFAFLPIKINDTTIVWLHKYSVKYRYKSVLVMTEWDRGYEFEWIEVDRWIGKPWL